eukprot:TRINITY_DN671_c0_g2_i1.p1 TRINITY_DN671_c0_g2~~TRINITY_DN671_c0_g2_i1.p1  ORF type:complete len:342 (+),score=76.06 TRINITY_DN671_c0_g2_i1:68-1093(+)
MLFSNSLIDGIFAFVMLMIASWSVGEGGEILGDKYDASIVGGLIIAWLNTAPEAIFAILALEGNNPKFALGALCGSTVVVTTIALGACLYFGAMSLEEGHFSLQYAVKVQSLILLVSCLLPLSMTITGYNYVTFGLGVLSYLGFIVYELTKKTDNEEVEDEEGGHVKSDSSSGEEQPLWKGVGYLILGGGLILAFSDNFIDSVVDNASNWNVNPILLAFFLAPIASEMPEVLESISLSRKGKVQTTNIAFSNLIGGTISKTTLLCGIFSFYGMYKEFEWQTPNFPTSLILLSTASGVAGFLGYFVNKFQKWHSFILFVVFTTCSLIQLYSNTGEPVIVKST